MNFHNFYTTATAAPFLCDKSYVEIEPCSELKPYIKCFWGSKKPYKKIKTDIPTQSLIIPDTCMDIIFDVNFTQNKIDNIFCTLDERSYYINYTNDKTELISTFGIRFYAWGAVFFADESLNKTRNSAFEVDCFFSKLKTEIEPKLFDITDIDERVDLVQRYLLNNIHLNRYSSIMNNSISEILLNKGNIKIDSLAKSVFTSSRQLERQFNNNMGISPKKFAALIRYQCLWQEILLSGKIDILDLTEKYGYSDQAHLLNDFKKFHSMTIPEAKAYAYKNVAFLQYK